MQPLYQPLQLSQNCVIASERPLPKLQEAPEQIEGQPLVLNATEDNKDRQIQQMQQQMAEMQLHYERQLLLQQQAFSHQYAMQLSMNGLLSMQLEQLKTSAIETSEASHHRIEAMEKESAKTQEEKITLEARINFLEKEIEHNAETATAQNCAFQEILSTQAMEINSLRTLLEISQKEEVIYRKHWDNRTTEEALAVIPRKQPACKIAVWTRQIQGLDESKKQLNELRAQRKTHYEKSTINLTNL